jgi:DNA primase
MSDDFARVKSALNIQTLITSESGLTMKGKHLEECPFCKGHECFSIREAQGSYNCFQCPPGESGGDVFTFLQRYHNIEPAEALKRAAELAHIIIEEKGTERKQRFSAAEKIRLFAAQHYHEHMLDNGGKSYLLEIRGHKLETLKKEMVGIADGRLLDHLRKAGFDDKDILESGLITERKVGDENRILDFFKKGLVVFPHYSGDKVLHFTQKDPEPDPEKKLKYQMKNEFRAKNWLFYGQDALEKFIEIILVEGENDRLQVLNTGIGYVMAMIGQISDEQKKALGNRCRGKHLYLWVDNDEAGKKYVRSICKALTDINIRIMVYGKPDDDPDSWLKGIPEGERRGEIKKLQLEALDYIAWELLQLEALPSLEAKLKELKDKEVFKLITQRSEIEQQIYMEKLEKIGFSKKAIEQALDFSQELYTLVSQYFAEISSPKDADPNTVAAIIYKYFAEHGRFYFDATNTVYLIYKNKTYEVGNNREFNSLMHKLTKMLYNRAPGNMVWEAIACIAYNHGRRIDRASWIMTDDVRGIIWTNLNGPNNTILRISQEGVKEMTNGMNDDHVLLSSSAEIKLFNFLPDADIQEGMDYFKTLIMDNFACDKKQRYFITCGVISTFLLETISNQAHFKLGGSSGGGKSTATEFISAFLYGKESLEDPTGAAAASVAAENPILIFDNLEKKDLTRTVEKLLLNAANRTAKRKRTTGSNSGTMTEIPRALIFITAIEPFTLPELINRTYDFWFDRKNPKFGTKVLPKAEIFRQIKRKRDIMLSALIKFIQQEILPNLSQTTDYMNLLSLDYPGHSKDRTNEYLSLLFLILHKLLPYIPFYDKDEQALLGGLKDDSGKYSLEEKDIRDAWIKEQDAKAKDTEVTSNNILKLFDGLVREYLLYFKDKKLEPTIENGFEKKVFKMEHPEYGLPLFKTVPEDVEIDGERYETSVIEFVAKSSDIVAALDRFCKNNGLRNPYPDAAVFGARLENDLKILEKGGWNRITKPGKEPYFKTNKGYNFFKFQHKLVR